MYLVIKALHIVMVTAWFAGLFYLPRIFVNLAMVPQPGAERDRLLLMARKLYRFMANLAAMSVVLGLWLWWGFGIGGGWMHVKLLLVVLLVAYHLVCGRMLARFEAGTETHKPAWFRLFNEMPLFLLLGIVLLVVLKPF